MGPWTLKSKRNGKERRPQPNRIQPGPRSWISSTPHPAHTLSPSFQEHPFPFFLQLRQYLLQEAFLMQAVPGPFWGVSHRPCATSTSV